MAKSRRGVQFQHRANGDANGRRLEISEDTSDPGSPSKPSAESKAEISKEEVNLHLYKLLVQAESFEKAG